MPSPQEQKVANKQTQSSSFATIKQTLAASARAHREKQTLNDLMWDLFSGAIPADEDFDEYFDEDFEEASLATRSGSKGSPTSLQSGDEQAIHPVIKGFWQQAKACVKLSKSSSSAVSGDDDENALFAASQQPGIARALRSPGRM